MNPCKDSKMCDCAKEYDKRGKAKKASHSAQTDTPAGLPFSALFSKFGSMFDGVGPWIPYIGGSALLLMLIGFLSKNVGKMLGDGGWWERDFSKSESSSSRPAAKVTDPEDDSCSAKCTMRIDTNKIKWPG